MRAATLWLAGERGGFVPAGYEAYSALRAINWLAGRGLASNDRVYWRVSERAAEGGRIAPASEIRPGDPAEDYFDAFETPGYDLLLAAAWSALGSPSYLPVQWLQVLASSALAFPIWGVARRIGGRRAAALAGLLFALYVPEALMAVALTREVWGEVFGVWMTWALLRRMGEGRAADAWIFGVTAALMVAFRGNLAPLPFAALAAAAFAGPWRRAVAPAAWAALCLGAFLAGWALRNHQVLGRWVVVREPFYLTVVAGMAEYDPSWRDLDPNAYRPAGRVEADGRVLRLFGNSDPWLRGPALDRFRGEWTSAILYPLRRVAKITHHQYWGFLPPKLQAAGAKGGVPFGVYLGIRACEYAVPLLAFLGLGVCRRSWRPMLVVAVVFAQPWLLYVALHYEPRYLTPHAWALLVLAAACVVTLANRQRGGALPG